MKVSQQLKRSFFIAISVFSVLNIFATEIIIRKDDDPKPPLGSTSLLEEEDYPVNANEDNTLLNVNFEQAVGNVTLRVYDSNQQLIYETLINTNVQNAAQIDISAFNSGEYTLTIQYTGYDLIGEFTIE